MFSYFCITLFFFYPCSELVREGYFSVELLVIIFLSRTWVISSLFKFNFSIRYGWDYWFYFYTYYGLFYYTYLNLRWKLPSLYLNFFVNRKRWFKLVYTWVNGFLKWSPICQLVLQIYIQFVCTCVYKFSCNGLIGFDLCWACR